MIRRVLAIAAMLLVVSATAANAQYIPDQPGFIITPPTTTPGGAISFSGQGCPPNSTVTFTLNGQVIGQGQAAADGTFFIPGQAPNIAPGQYTVIATCGDVTMSNILTIVSGSSTIIPGTSGTLPQTGSNSLVIARVALALLAVGGLIVLGTRRRRATA